VPYALVQTSAPAVEPIGIDEARKHCRITTTDDDDQIAAMIVDARVQAETSTDRQLITATWELGLDSFPTGTDPIYLPLGRLQSVTSIIYLDTSGASQTLSSANYRVITRREPGIIVPARGLAWPMADYQAESVVVKFVCGFGLTERDVPRLLRRAMLLCIGSWYINREDIITSDEKSKPILLPRGSAEIFEQFRLGDEFVCYGGQEYQT
jgi:uncharacterized phiE125 gp8 family phage protein